jgi:antitoxin YefM
MSTVSVTDAKTNLDSLVRETAESHEPILITAHGANAVPLPEDDWRSVQETLYLLSVPGMRESERRA